MPFQISYRSRRVERDLLGLEETNRQRIMVAIEGLSADPRPRGSVSLQARHGAFRIRVGNYRVVYSIDYEEGVVSIDDILLRNERTYRRG
jgi:mRNA interferase RelE/StbE